MAHTRAANGRGRLRERAMLALPFPLIYIALLIISIPKGGNTLVTVYRLPLFTYSAQAVQVFGGSDAGSLLGAAMSLRWNSGLMGNMFWVYNLWPPGLVVIDRIMLSIEAHFDIPIVLQMVLLNCLVWTLFIGGCFLVLRVIAGRLTAYLFTTGLFLYSGLTLWGLRTGLFYSDSFGVIGYCTAIVFLILVARSDTRRKRVTNAVLAGVSLGVACYFRASFELVADATLLIAGAFLLAAVGANLLKRLPRFSAAVRPVAASLVITGAVTQLLLLPWRAYAGLKIHPGDFRWSTVSDLTSAARWIPDSVLLQNNAGFAAAGHSNWGCINDRVKCEQIYAFESLTSAPYSASPDGYYSGAEFNHILLDSFLAHPFTFIGERITALSFGFASNTGGQIKDLALGESMLLVVLFIATVVVIIRKRLFADPGYLFFLFGTAVQFATLALLHMEPRYFLGIELGIIVVSAFVLGTAARSRREVGTTAIDPPGDELEDESTTSEDPVAATP